MPHLHIEYSSNLEQQCDFSVLCREMAKVFDAYDVYPKAGLRIRAVAHDHFVVADQHPNNSFVDMVLRIAVGRDSAIKTQTGKDIMAVAEEFFAELLSQRHLMLSLEIIEINSDFSWKINPVHQRMNEQG